LTDDAPISDEAARAASELEALNDALGTLATLARAPGMR
jgi:hypothetical protein